MKKIPRPLCEKCFLKNERKFGNMFCNNCCAKNIFSYDTALKK